MNEAAKYIIGAFGASMLVTASARAHSPTYAYEGLFAGSMTCENGEIGVLFHIEEIGSLLLKEFNLHQEPCRSGRGPCNDFQNRRFEGSRKVKGTLDIFPTASNPKMPSVLLQITGIGMRVESPESAAKAVALPHSFHTSLDITSFETHSLVKNNLSGLNFKITIANPLAKPPYDKMFSQVYGHQCHNLILSRLKEPKP